MSAVMASSPNEGRCGQVCSRKSRPPGWLERGTRRKRSSSDCANNSNDECASGECGQHPILDSDGSLFGTRIVGVWAVHLVHYANLWRVGQVFLTPACSQSSPAAHNLYAVRNSAAEVAAHFGVSEVPQSNAPEKVYPGYPGMVVRERDGVRMRQSMAWGFPLRLKAMSPTAKPNQ